MDRFSDKNTSISYDEEIIFEILQHPDENIERVLNINADNLPREKEFHKLAASINKSNSSMVALMNNHAPRPITCKRRFFAPFVIFFRKVLRKFFLKWYIEPICDQQTDFNIATNETIRSIVYFSEHQLTTLNELYAKNQKLEEELKKERKMRQELDARIQRLERSTQ